MLRDKIIKYISDTFSEISPDTVRIYTNKFSKMSDEDIKEYFKVAKVRLYVKDDNVDEDKIDNLVNKLNVIPQEQMILPYKANSKTKSEVMILPIQIRRLQQLATKQSKSSMDINSRNKAGQADGDAKTGKITDPEVNQLASIGLDRVLTELMSPRSDNMSGKRNMNSQIEENLEFELAKIPVDRYDKSTLVYIDALYKCMNVATDFIDLIDDIS